MSSGSTITTGNTHHSDDTVPSTCSTSSSSDVSSTVPSSSSLSSAQPPQPVLPSSISANSGTVSSMTSTNITTSSPWIIQTSRKTGKPYWFNTKTGVSVWEEPVELRTTLGNSTHALTINTLNTNHSSTSLVSSSLPSSSSSTTTIIPSSSSSSITVAHPSVIPPTGVSYRDPLSFTTVNNELIQAKDNIPLCRTAIEKICQRLVEGKNTLAGAEGYHRFPPMDNKTLKFIIYEMADEYELQCESIGKEGTLKHIVIYRKGCEPEDVLLLQQEEEALQKEAELRKQQEMHAEAMAIARTALQRLEASRETYVSSATDSAKEHTSASASSSSLPNRVGEMVEVVPLFKKKDKRSISEIQAEIKAKKQKLSDHVNE